MQFEIGVQLKKMKIRQAALFSKYGRNLGAVSSLIHFHFFFVIHFLAKGGYCGVNTQTIITENRLDMLDSGETDALLSRTSSSL